MKFKKGYLLIELMVALSIFLIAVIAFLGLLSNSLSLNRDIADKFTANYLAAEGIELAKNLVDANILEGGPWNAGIGGSFNAPKCFEIDYTMTNNNNAFGVCDLNSTQAPNFLNYSSSAGYTYSSGTPTPFKRYIMVFPPSADAVKVTSVVVWTGRGNSANRIYLEDYFFTNK